MSKRPYLGQSPPGNTPEIFAPGILSKAGRKECTLTFTPDGKEIYFTVIKAGNDYIIKLYELVDGEGLNAFKRQNRIISFRLPKKILN